ncbi:SDR family oxidoreductase [Nibrella viscosa]|uniref:SDR family oxidoreductase n=1 Tax=Nibrella viscosa TaxID=1084524 RepID=A0ABP8KGG0_9BACT
MQLSTSEKNRLRQQYGPWAIVTGASSGIGLELAQQLAGAGLNLVINARKADRLEPVAHQLKTEYSSKIRVVAADVSEPLGVRQLIDQTADLDIGLLVLSAGYGTSGLFLQSDLAEEMNMVRVNIEAVLALAHHYGNRFARQQRGGLILLSSMVAFQGVPYAANYAATKAYVQSLAEALALELKPAGVDVLAAAPGPVKTGFEQRANMQMGFSLTPAQVGVPILRALGRRSTVLPGGLTKLLVYSLRTVPRWGKVRIMKLVMGGMTQHQRQVPVSA